MQSIYYQRVLTVQLRHLEILNAARAVDIPVGITHAEHGQLYIPGLTCVVNAVRVHASAVHKRTGTTLLNAVLSIERIGVPLRYYGTGSEVGPTVLYHYGIL